MTPERWRKIEEVFQAALDHPADQRALFLDHACAGDVALRTQIELLIASHERAGSFIETPALAAYDTLPGGGNRGGGGSGGAADESMNPIIGQRIGAYKIVREIGRGGMGAVYLAARDDDVFQKRVAIKLVKRGMDTDFILRRFRHERQILANLDHPNIARLLDGGTTRDGLPYFVMEYIEGRPIHQYCDARMLPIAERLRLFRHVCSALHYAHQNQIIHRDIKPSNILVTADGTPKLLDFGIAKLLNPELALDTIDPTATALRLMTPEYASPEQARGEPATIASDIYSLGVLLYELLTGHRPYPMLTRLPQEITRIICEERPARPSTVISHADGILLTDPIKNQNTITPDVVGRCRGGASLEALRRELAGDLDQIVMKAISKEPPQRYPSVAQFSDDIRRHLGGLSISAPTLPPHTDREKEPNTGETPTGAKSIAVLPFNTLHVENKEDEFLGLGMADALITKLSNIRQFTVRPTSSVIGYIDGNRDLLAAGYELGVGSVLDGRIQQAGDRIRVTVQLVSMENGAPMWAAQFDENFTDILSVQDSISEQVAQALTEKLSGEERLRLTKHYTDNPEAYQAYLKGRYFSSNYSEEDLNKAIGYFSEAIRIDPHYALAYAGIADYYNWLGVWGVLPPEKSVALAKEAAANALAIDDMLGEAHASLAFARWSYDRDWVAAEQGFSRALELNPGYATAHHWYALFLSTLGRHAEALAEIERAQKIDPLSLGISTGKSLILHNARRYDEAVEQLRGSLEMEPHSYVAHQGLAWTYAQQGMHKEAIEAAEKAIQLSSRLPLLLFTLGQVYALAGRRAEARAIVTELEELYLRYYVSPYYIAFIYATLDERDDAFKWFEEAYRRRDFWLAMMRVEPRFDGLRADPRFQDLLRRLAFLQPTESSAAAAAAVATTEIDSRFLNAADAGPSAAAAARSTNGRPPGSSGTDADAAPPQHPPAAGPAAAAAAAAREDEHAGGRGGWRQFLVRARAVSSAVLVAVLFAAAGLVYLAYRRAAPSTSRLRAPLVRLTGNLAPDQQPDWSPDGTRIVFTSSREGKQEIYVLEIESRDMTRLTLNSAEDFTPAWSPDGTRIAFTSKRDGNDEIYVMNADGSNQTNISNNPAADSRPGWSPDGTKIVFISNRDGKSDNFEIYVTDAAAGNTTTRLTHDDGFDSDPAWSPDGAHIAFASNRSGNFEVYVMNADGSLQTNISNNAAFDGKPAWSPDGAHLAFTSNREDEAHNFEIWMMNAPYGEYPRRVTNSAGTDDEPAWSPDNTRLTFQSERDGNFEIYVSDVAGERRTAGPKLRGTKSLAVLPFTAGGAAPAEDVYLGAGLADILSTKLGLLRQISVRPASATRRYLDLTEDPPTVGRELGVDYILTGSVRRSGDRVAVEAKLISVRDGNLMWAGKYDEMFTDIDAVQNLISERVTRELKLELTSDEQRMLAKRYTDNSEAYQLYLAGRYHWGKRTVDSIKQAIGLFQQAIEKDEDYALAYAGLADCYALLHWYVVPPPADAFPNAKAAAARAIQLDDALAEAHASLAFVHLYFDRDLRGAEREFRRAIALNPNYATAHHWYAFNLSAMGRHAEARAEIKLAQELDPRSLIINTAAANLLYYERAYDEAIEQCLKILDLDPGFVPAYLVLRGAYTSKGMYDEAFAVFQREKTYAADSQGMLARLGHYYAAAGKRAEAARILAELNRIRNKQPFFAYEIAVMHALSGDADAAFEWLEKAYQERSIGFVFVKVDPDLDKIRADPRFAALLARVGFEP